MAYTMPQQRKNEESERLRGEKDQIKFIDLRFEGWQVGLWDFHVPEASGFNRWRYRQRLLPYQPADC